MTEDIVTVEQHTALLKLIQCAQEHRKTIINDYEKWKEITDAISVTMDLILKK